MTLRKYMPSKEERDRVRAEHSRMEAVMGFWFDHHDEILARYPEQYVAVKDPLAGYEVVASDKSILVVLDTVDGMGLDRRALEIEFMTSKIRAPMPVLFKSR